MKFKVNLTSQAESDLVEIYKYVKKNDSIENAENLFKNIYKKCLALKEFPERGHKLPEMKFLDIEFFLENHYKSYRIIYQIINKEVFIHYILDGRRDILKILNERLINL